MTLLQACLYLGAIIPEGGKIRLSFEDAVAFRAAKGLPPLKYME